MPPYRIHPIVMGTNIFHRTNDENVNPPQSIRALEMDIIPPGAHVNA